MRRVEREITDPEELDQILQQASLLHLGLHDGPEVYVVPLNYGYRAGALYLHSALEGRKIECLKRDPEVCFTIIAEQTVVPAAKPCGWSLRFRSIIGWGTARFLTTVEEKRAGLEVFMDQFTTGPHELPDEAVANTAVIRIDIKRLTGKRNEKR